MQNPQLSLPLGLLALLVLCGGTLIVGWLGARHTRGNKEATELWLAGRRLPWALAFCSMTATWVGGGYLNGTAEEVYNSQRGLVWAQAPWGYALSLVLGGLFFARALRRTGAITLLDPFSSRYGRKTAKLFAVPALLGEIFWSGAILAALGTTLEIILGLDFNVVVIVSTALVISYTARGGLWSVAYTDVLQLAGIVIGLGLALPFALEHVGGITEVVERYRHRYGAAASVFATPRSLGLAWWSWLDLALLFILGGIPWQDYTARVLACRSDTQAVTMSVAGAFGCLALAVPAILLGAVAGTADWGAAGAPENPALALPAVLRYLTPPWVAVIGLTAVASAVVSSVDSSFLSGASLVTRNLLGTGKGPPSPGGFARAVMIVGCLGAALALSVKSVYALWALSSDLVYVLLFPQLVVVLWIGHTHRAAAVAGLLVGLVLRLGGGEPLLGIPAWLPYPWPGPDGITFFPFRTVAMLSGLVTTIVGARLLAMLRSSTD